MVFIYHPMKQVLQLLEVLWRLVKWVVVLSQFEIFSQPCTAVDFIAELTFSLEKDRDHDVEPLR